MGKKFLAQLKSLKINRGLISPGGGRKIQKSTSFPSCIKHPRVYVSLCLTPVWKTFYEKLRVKSKDFYSNQFWWQHWNAVCNMTGQFKTLVFKYDCEINIYYLIVKFTANMAVNSMFICKIAAILAHDLECIYLFKLLLSCIVTWLTPLSGPIVSSLHLLGWGYDFPKMGIRGGMQIIL